MSCELAGWPDTRLARWPVFGVVFSHPDEIRATKISLGRQTHIDVHGHSAQREVYFSPGGIIAGKRG